MSRIIEDADYIECLPSLYRKHYYLWKERMLGSIDQYVKELEECTPEQLMEKYELTNRDVALLVRLHYFTDEEIERFDLRRIASMVSA